MEFVIKCEPPKHTAQGSNTILKSRTGKYFIGKKKTSKANQTRLELSWLLKSFAPKVPFSGPLKVQIDWVYPFRKSEPKKNRGNDLPCYTRPDIDNLCKLLFDVMTDLRFWLDDAQISCLSFRKIWSDKPHIKIKIENI